MARTTYARMPEKAVQRDIVVFLGLLGYLVCDFSQPRASMQTPGIPDLYAMGHGAALWIEVKTASGRVSAAQAAWHEAARAAGQTVVVARCAADLVETLRLLGAPIDART